MIQLSQFLFLWRYFSLIKNKQNIRLSHKFSTSTLENSPSFAPVFVQGSSYCVRAVEALKHPQEGLDPPLGHFPPRWVLGKVPKVSEMQ